MQQLKQILLSNGIKPTYQRIKILEYLQNNNNHPTVDMIYTALADQVPTLSKTTVYNTLDIFFKHGLITILTITGLEQRYDYHTEPHHHFLCRKCHRIIDLNVKCPFLQSNVFGSHKIEEIHGYFKGICQDCLEEEK